MLKNKDSYLRSKRKKPQLVRINLLAENCLNGKFYWPNVFHYGFKYQSLTWMLHCRSQNLQHVLKSLMTSISKKKKNKLKQNKIKVSFLFRHEGKVFSCKDISFFISEDLTWSLVAGPVFLPRELSTDLKNTDFCFWNIGKTRDFVVKHYINFVYMMRISFFFCASRFLR